MSAHVIKGEDRSMNASSAACQNQAVPEFPEVAFGRALTAFSSHLSARRLSRWRQAATVGIIGSEPGA